MPRPRYQTADPALKSRLMKAAIAEFAKHGYESASLNRMLDAAEISKGSFYYYFDDKADLAATVIEEISEEVWPAMKFPDLKDAASFWDTMSTWQHGALEALLRAREKMEAISRLGASMSRDPELAKRIAPLIASKNSELVPFIQRAQELGVVRKDIPAPILLAIVAAIKEAVGRTSLPPDRAATQEEFERTGELVMDLFKRIARPE